MLRWLQTQRSSVLRQVWACRCRCPRWMWTIARWTWYAWLQACIHPYMCIRTSMHACITRACIHAHTRMDQPELARVRTCMPTCMDACMHAHIHAHIRMYVRAHIHSTDVHTYMRTHVHMHTSVRTYICLSIRPSYIHEYIHACIHARTHARTHAWRMA